MIPTVGQLEGQWQSKDFPMFEYKDNIQLVLYFGSKMILYLQDNKNNPGFVQGEYQIEPLEDGNFKIVVLGDDFRSPEYKEIYCKWFVGGDNPAFVADIPSYGNRYFIKPAAK